MTTQARGTLYGREEIEEIIPHRGPKILLDSVIINPEEVRGEFLVTNEVCEGHGIFEGLDEKKAEVLRGSDLLDMAAQALGIYAHYEYSDLRGKNCFVRQYGEAKFIGGFVWAGDRLVLYLKTNSINRQPKGNFDLVTGNDFFIRRIREHKPSEEKLVARVAFVELAIGHL